jgi:hypothetical protein
VELLIKILQNEFVLSASSNTTVNSAVVVRIVHTGTQEHLITIGNGVGSNIGTFTVINNSELILEKHRTDTLQVDSGTDVRVVSIAYRN